MSMRNVATRTRLRFTRSARRKQGLTRSAREMVSEMRTTKFTKWHETREVCDRIPFVPMDEDMVSVFRWRDQGRFVSRGGLGRHSVFAKATPDKPAVWWVARTCAWRRGGKNSGRMDGDGVSGGRTRCKGGTYRGRMELDRVSGARTRWKGGRNPGRMGWDRISGGIGARIGSMCAMHGHRKPGPEGCGLDFREPGAMTGGTDKRSWKNCVARIF